VKPDDGVVADAVSALVSAGAAVAGFGIDFGVLASGAT
jgi:hypothetical protein